MATESTKKIINLPKKDLIDHLDLSFTTGLTVQNSAVLTTDLQGKTFTFGNIETIEGQQAEVNSYTVGFSELVTNLLLSIDPDITANDITDVNTGNDFSKITVEYT